MKKTGIALLLTFGFAASLGVCAADIAVSDTDITVSGIKAANENVRLNVTDTDGNLIWLDSAEADGEGKYELKLKVPFLDTSKEYVLTVNGTEKENLIIDGSDEILEKLSSITEAEFDSYIKTYAERFGLNTEDYTSLKDTKSAYKVFKSFNPDKTEIKTAFEKMLGICMINESDRGGVLDILKKYSEKIAPKYETDIKNLNQSQLEKFAVELSGSDYYSMPEFESGYSAALKTARNYGKSDSGSSGGGGSSSKGSSGGKGGFVAPPNTSTNTDPKPGNNEDENKEPFSDLAEADWAKESILKLYEKGIINGKENGRFAPNDTVTREEFTAMIVRAFNLKSQNKAAFSDVESGAWYEEAVNAAVENKIINGISESRFGVSEELTRQDCAAMCARILDYLGVQTENAEEIFADDEKIADYAKEAVYRLKKLGIINGMGENTFSPEASCTRAMTAKIIDLLGEYGK